MSDNNKQADNAGAWLWVCAKCGKARPDSKLIPVAGMCCPGYGFVLTARYKGDKRNE